MASHQTARGGSAGEGTFSRVQRVALLVLALLLAWVARDLILLLFAGVLLGVFLRTLSVFIAERTTLSTGWSLLIVIGLLLALAVVAGALFAPRLAEEARALSQSLPQAASRLVERVRETTFGGWVLEQIGGATPQDHQDTLTEQATGAARKVLDGVVAFGIILFTGLYLAAAPAPYLRGVLLLVRPERRRRAAEALFAAGYTRRWWILGQLLSMTVVGLMMGIGLALIGVPLAFALGVLAGLFEFIPTIGPIFGLLPALLLALADDPTKALYVLALYSVVQTLESYLLTPLVQERVLDLPPVVTIATQVLFAWTLGPVGLLIAVPFVAVVMVLVQMLYVKDFLGEPMHLTAEEEARRELGESDFVRDLAGV